MDLSNAAVLHNDMREAAQLDLRKRFSLFASRSGELTIKRFVQQAALSSPFITDSTSPSISSTSTSPSSKITYDFAELDLRRKHLFQAIDVNFTYEANWRMVVDCVLAGHSHILRRGPWNRWAELLAHAIESAQHLDDQKALASLHYKMGELCIKQSSWQKSYYHLHQAEQLYETLEDKVWLARTWCLLAEHSWSQGDFTKADAYAFHALEAQEVSGNEVGLAKAYATIASVAYYKNEFSETIEWYKKALDIPQCMDEPGLAAETHYYIGVAYKLFNQDDLALQHYEQAQNIAEAIGDDAMISYILFGLMGLAMSAGQISQALTYATRIRDIAERIGAQATMAHVLFVSGQLSLYLQRQAEAQTYYAECSRIAKQIQHWGHYTNSLIGTTTAHLQLGNIEEADETLQLAKQAFDKASYAHNVENSILFLDAKIARARDDLRTAISKYEKSYKMAADTRNNSILIGTALDLAKTHFAQGSSQEANQWIETARQAAEDANLGGQKAKIEEMLAKHALSTGDIAAAKERYEAALDHLRQQPSELNNLKLAKIERQLQEIAE